MAEGRYLHLKPLYKPKGDIVKPTPQDFEEAITVQDARDCGLLLACDDTYPWKALTGRKLPVEGDWSKHTYDEYINVYTDIEAGLRAAMEDVLAALLIARNYVELPKALINIDDAIKLLTESLAKFKHLPK